MRRHLEVAICAALVLCMIGLTSACSRTRPATGPTVERYSQKLRDAVASNVQDPTRRTQMLVIVDQVEELHMRFARETATFVASYRTLNSDYETQRPAFDNLFSGYDAQRIKARSEAFDLHMQLGALATPAEWGAIQKAEQKLYEEVNAVRQSEGGA